AGTAMDARTVKIPMTRVVVTFMAILRFERKGARGTHGTASAVADGGRMWHGRPTAASRPPRRRYRGGMLTRLTLDDIDIDDEQAYGHIAIYGAVRDYLARR